jgi:cytochrome c oxidase accessory protein FixG
MCIVLVAEKPKKPRSDDRMPESQMSASPHASKQVTGAGSANDGALSVETFIAEPVNSKEHRDLYEARKKIHPKRAKGTFRSLKWWVMAVTLGIYYITPWLRWDRGPHAPDQAVLIDLANTRFYFFFIEIWPQEFFFVAGLLVMAGIGLFLVTSTVGRAWCGYTCPQTVWVDLFLVVERFVEGDRNARIKLDDAPMTTGKAIKRLIKHAAWLIIAVLTGGAWIFYFADAPTLLPSFLSGQAHYVAYATVAVLTFTTYVLGGLLREQVCTYMCPWPRIQAAMLDEHSLVVTYNDWRGEPRSRHAKRARAAGNLVGDCVDCNACVAVCPMGIDIRDGQQLECITCALCIDACDGVMQKVGLERGLIAYATLNDYAHNMRSSGAKIVNVRGDAVWDFSTIDQSAVRPDGGTLASRFMTTKLSSFLRPRTLVYAAIWGAIGIGLLVALLMRDRLDVNVRHDRNPVYVMLSDGGVRNGYDVKILNMVPQPRTFTVSLKGLPGGRMTIAGSQQPPATQVDVSVKPDKLRSFRVFVQVPKQNIVVNQTEFEFRVSHQGGTEKTTYRAQFNGPRDQGK